MFDIGMSEILVIAVVAIIVVGPKDLPKLLRTVGKTISGVKRMAGDFQQQFNDAIEESDLADIKNIATGKSFNPLDSIKEAVDDVKNDFNDGLNDTSNKSASDDVKPLFPENETSKRLANLDSKTASKAKMGAVKSDKAKTRKKTMPKKTGVTKTVKAKATVKKTASKSDVKKPVVKKTTQAKTKSAAT